MAALQRPFVRRRSSAMLAEHGQVRHYAKILTEFQVEKLTHLFMVMFRPANKDDNVTEADMMQWVERIRVYSKLDKSDSIHVRNIDVHMVFFDALREQLKMEKAALLENIPRTWEDARTCKIQIDDQMNLVVWLNMWAKLMRYSKGLADFPIWVQYLPDIIYDTIDTDNSTYLEVPELEKYYKDFLGANIPNLPQSTQKMHKAMAVNGESVLNRVEFRSNYANFLLCRNKVGAGKFLFGPMAGALEELAEE